MFLCQYLEDFAKYDFLIVGSGLFGAIFANIVKNKGYTILIIEKNHIVGNIYKENINGINLHKYGAQYLHF